MKRLTQLLTVVTLTFAAIFLFAAPQATAQDVDHGINFIDENGDGYNDNAPDADGDGIPNGMDEDYVRAGVGKNGAPQGFVDEDGDGINDLAPDADGDGIPNGQDADFVKGAGNSMANGQARGKGIRGFVDENGDGFNDLAPDVDGDGIPNGQDPDYVAGQGCTGDGSMARGRNTSGFKGGNGPAAAGSGSGSARTPQLNCK